MTTTLDHILVPAHSKDRSARFLADMLKLEVTDESSGPGPAGTFAVVRVGATTLDFADMNTFDTHHYAFAVSDELFDAVLSRLKSAGIEHSADPGHTQKGELYHDNGGRGMYFHDPQRTQHRAPHPTTTTLIRPRGTVPQTDPAPGRPRQRRYPADHSLRNRSA